MSWRGKTNDQGASQHFKVEAEDLMTRFQSCLDISVDEREGFLFANVPGPFEHRLYPTKVKTAEPIRTKFYVGPHMTVGMVYGYKLL